jgi:hypothetical protein
LDFNGAPTNTFVLTNAQRGLRKMPVSISRVRAAIRMASSSPAALAEIAVLGNAHTGTH